MFRKLTLSHASKLAREPIVHFLLIGAVLYLLSTWLTAGSGAPNRIEISAATVRHLEATFFEVWGRAPTGEERERLIKDYVREEIAYREALNLGLDRDDVIVRRRLRQKLEFLAEDTATVSPPSDEQLQELLSEDPSTYSSEPLVSLKQFSVSSLIQKSNTAELQALLDRLNKEGLQAKLQNITDSSTVPEHWPLAPVSEFERTFGTEFTNAIQTLEPDVWHGPIESGIGKHFVYVTDVIPSRMPDLESVRSLLEHDFLARQRAQQIERMYLELGEKYVVIKEPLPGSTR